MEKEIQTEKTETISEKHIIVQQKSRESFLGALLLVFIILFVVVSAAGVGFAIYSQWTKESTANSSLSIAEIPQKTNQETEDAVPAETKVAVPPENAVSSEVNDSEVIAAAKKLEISVLNGGAAKGSAGVLINFLKQDGYLKTDMGNTLKDYIGVTIYYAASLEKEAEIIKESVIKKYPQAKIMPADTKNKESSVSQVTIIIGK